MTATTLTTRMATFDWHLQMARGDYKKELLKMVGLLSDESLLTELGFQRRWDPDFTDADVKGEDDVARALVELVRNCLAHELKVLRYYSCRAPGKFMPLIDDYHANAKTETLQWCKDALEAIFNVEALAQNGNSAAERHLDGMLRDMIWPKNSWCRLC